MKVTIIPTVIGAFGTVIKGLLKGPMDLEVGGREDVKNSQWVNNNNNNNNNDKYAEPSICPRKWRT